MPKHAAPRARSPFWSTVLTGTAAAAIVSGTWGLVEPVSVPGAAHMSWDGKAQVAGCADLTVSGTTQRAQCLGVPQAASKVYFNCATMGNHICGPGNPEGIPAGCYEDLQDEGTLVVAWTRYDDPHADPLWAQANPTGNCLAIAGTQLAPLDEVDTDLALAR